LTWSVSSSGENSQITKYQVSLNEIDWIDKEPTDTFHEFAGLEAGAEYTLYLRAVNVIGESPTVNAIVNIAGYESGGDENPTNSSGNSNNSSGSGGGNSRPTKPGSGSNSPKPNENQNPPSEHQDSERPPQSENNDTISDSGDNKSSEGNSREIADKNDSEKKAGISEIISEAIKSDDSIVYLNEKDGSVISGESLKAIKNAGKEITFVLDNGFKIKINPDKISDNVKSIDLNMQIAAVGDKPDIINDILVSANSIIVIPSAKGEFGFEIIVEITAQMLEEAGLTDKEIYLYYISDNGVISSLGQMSKTANGTIEFPISHASYYLLSGVSPDDILSAETRAADETGHTGGGNPNTGVSAIPAGLLISAAAIVIFRKKKTV
ncbi:MAG: NPXTG-anchored protein, partial [Eubacterium sp.]|nr:NPXTG-anchored protein [Eubacterium sp.]